MTENNSKEESKEKKPGANYQIINLFAGPGVGKSTISAGLFYKLKTNHYNTEMVFETAKDYVYDGGGFNITCAVGKFGEQFRRIERLIKYGVHYIIVDSPLLLSLVYPHNYSSKFDDYVFDVVKNQNNTNFFLNRNDKYDYDKSGRIHSKQESIDLDQKILEVLLSNGIPHTRINVDETTVDTIYKTILERE